ncbi:magnesium/cobalt transporter CorA [Lacisediminimonas sp.]|uniref:magnesium/cobalt transporter CorA n=1 Tax=Lacisediminimonas sp. TaxID=3060582 RepID=UPI002719C656|nr:magnesium/cobalt transporter CorA [Lacisediminimonas sp.]MDO8301283.1 magnesium/cobalt transporter CorA [Lacisediminimonas sp.]
MNQTNGVVNCSAYKNGVKIGDIQLDDISDVLQQKDVFVWVGLFEPGDALLRKLQVEFGLHELAIEDAHKAHQRPKIEEYGETLFLVLQTATLENATIAFGETHIFLGKNFLLTVRHGASASFAKVRERAESMPERLARGPGFALYALIDFVVDQYQPCMDHLQSQFRSLEERLFSPASDEDALQNFYRLKNELLALQAAAVPLIEICTQLLRFHEDIIPRESRVYFRDILDHVSRVTQAADRMREMINAAMQVALAQVTIRQNEVVKRLAGWGAMVAVPTMVFSLYGMNFRHMPELQWEWSYPVVMAIIAGASIVLYRRLKRAGWL